MASLPEGVRRLVCGRRDERVRATWRGLHPIVLFVGVSLVGLPLVETVAGMARDVGLGRGTPWVLGVAIVGVVVYVPWILAGVTLATRLDRRPLSDYGLELSVPWTRDFSGGLVIGLAMAAAPIAVALVFGYGEITDVVTADPPTLAGSLCLLVVAFGLVALAEETFFRGVMIRNFAEGLSARSYSPGWALLWAVLASSCLFGLFHVIFSGGGGVAGRSLDIVVSTALFGLIVGCGYVVTGTVGLPVGIHLGYNVANGAIFPVSLDRTPEISASLLSVAPTAEWFWDPYVLTAVRTVPALVFVLAWVYLTRRDLALAEDLARLRG